MIRFDSLPPEVMQAMCTPMHQILAPALVHGITTGALYLGSLSAATDKDLLRQHHITHVVHVLGDGYWFPSNPGGESAGGVWKDGFCSYRIDILDDSTEDLGRHLERVCGFIDSSLRSGRNLLVHCHQVLPISFLSFLFVSPFLIPLSLSLLSFYFRVYLVVHL